MVYDPKHKNMSCLGTNSDMTPMSRLPADLAKQLRKQGKLREEHKDIVSLKSTGVMVHSTRTQAHKQTVISWNRRRRMQMEFWFVVFCSFRENKSKTVLNQAISKY